MPLRKNNKAEFSQTHSQKIYFKKKLCMSYIHECICDAKGHQNSTSSLKVNFNKAPWVLGPMSICMAE